MKITIDEDVLKKNHLKLSDYLYILLRKEYLKNDECEYDVRQRLIDEGIITVNCNLTVDGKDLFDKINKKFYGKKEREIDQLVLKLQELWPEGYKDRKYKWRSNETDVKTKLYKFFEIYGKKFTNVTDEQIVEAAQKYVTRFNNSGDRTFQKILKYFILSQNNEGSLLADNLEAIFKNEGFDDCSSTDSLF